MWEHIRKLILVSVFLFLFLMLNIDRILATEFMVIEKRLDDHVDLFDCDSVRLTKRQQTSYSEWKLNEKKWRAKNKPKINVKEKRNLKQMHFNHITKLKMNLKNWINVSSSKPFRIKIYLVWTNNRTFHSHSTYLCKTEE